MLMRAPPPGPLPMLVPTIFPVPETPMAAYRAPLADIRYLMRDVIDYAGHYAKLPGCNGLGMDEVDMVLDGAARFAEDVLHPLYRSGDESGCRFENGKIVEHWGVPDRFALLHQLGLLPLPPSDAGA